MGDVAEAWWEEETFDDGLSFDEWEDDWVPIELVPEAETFSGAGQYLWMAHAAEVWREYRSSIIRAHLTTAMLRKFEADNCEEAEHDE